MADDSTRPFGQRRADRSLKPTFEGFHYKFSLLVPVSEVGKNGTYTIFTDSDLENLETLFREDFGGFTVISYEKPVHRGEWLDEDSNEIIVNEHDRYEVYSRRDEKAIGYFTELKARLKNLSREKEIVIEVTEVTFIENSPFRV